MAELISLATPRGSAKRHVIFVHGLDGDPNKTWLSQRTSTEKENAWPKWLPRFGAKREPKPVESELWPTWLAADIGEVAVWTVRGGAIIGQ